MLASFDDQRLSPSLPGIYVPCRHDHFGLWICINELFGKETTWNVHDGTVRPSAYGTISASAYRHSLGFVQYGIKIFLRVQLSLAIEFRFHGLLP